MSKFTKGPWKAGGESQELLSNGKLTRRYIPIYEASSLHPHWARNEPTDHPHPIIAGVHICEESDANAHLIAAAPELYDALEWIFKATKDELGSNFTESSMGKSIAATLAKARGES